MLLSSINLHEALWEFKKSDWNQWRDSSYNSSGRDIFTDLLHHQLIADPFLNTNELQSQWVGESDWQYRCYFKIPKHRVLCQYLLKFKGLDTFVDVYLDNKLLLKSENQFHEHSIDITNSLNNNKDIDTKKCSLLDAADDSMVHCLEFYFHSCLLKGRELEKKFGKKICSNGEFSRVHVRKSQYQYGWDWGPKLISCGPYRDISLLIYDHETFIENVNVKSVLQGKSAVVKAEVVLHKHTNNYEELDEEFKEFVVIRPTPNYASIRIDLCDPKGGLIKSQLLSRKANQNVYYVKFELENPKLWNPVGSGEQHLYHIKAFLAHDDSNVFKRKFGLKKVELIQESIKYEEGLSFYFKVNNKPIFCAGSCWIPLDSFITRVNKSTYTDYLKKMVAGNQNMVRVWGGGFYESDHFYEECDRLGIMVFQDFMFACGEYPTHKEFYQNVKKEIEDQLRRLRNYTSIIYMVGNNEDYVLAKELDYTPAREIYEILIPKSIDKLCPWIIYNPSSPWGGSDSNSTKIGDLHQWKVWHGKEEKYQNWDKLGGRFVSEFGMESFPTFETLSSAITSREALIDPQSRLIEFHNKAGGFERKLGGYLSENFSINSSNINHYIYLTQLLQSECLSFAIKYFRRNWKNNGERSCGGALIWQLNDCWPGISWSIIDYLGKPKLGYYAMKREFSEIVIGTKRKEYLKGTNEEPEKLIDQTHDYREKDYEIETWINNFGGCKKVKFQYKVFSITSGQLLFNFDQIINCQDNGTTNLLPYKIPEVLDPFDIVICGKLFDNNKEIYTNYDWPQPLKYTNLSTNRMFGHLDYRVFTNNITFSCNRPMKGIEIIIDKNISLSDNGFDLCPGDLKTVKAEGISVDDNVIIKYY